MCGNVAMEELKTDFFNKKIIIFTYRALTPSQYTMLQAETDTNIIPGISRLSPHRVVSGLQHIHTALGVVYSVSPCLRFHILHNESYYYHYHYHYYYYYYYYMCEVKATESSRSSMVRNTQLARCESWYSRPRKVNGSDGFSSWALTKSPCIPIEEPTHPHHPT